MNIHFRVAAVVVLVASAAVSVMTGASPAAAAGRMPSHTCPPGMHWVPADNTCDDNPVPPRPTTVLVGLAWGSSRTDWGNEHQTVQVTLWEEFSGSPAQPKGAHVEVDTHTWTDNVAVGFHATSSAMIGPNLIATSPQRYGVDATIFADHDLTAVYNQNVDLATAVSDAGGIVYSQSLLG